MKSDICRILRDGSGLSAIIKEVERCAAYSGVEGKQSLQLQLLAEELVGMLPELLRDCVGEFWVESSGKSFELHVKALAADMGIERRENLLAVSKSGKNAAAKGIMGKIRSVAESMLAQMAAPEAAPIDCYANSYMAMAYQNNVWTLHNYINQVEAAYKNDDGKEEWDELEKSVIASAADDVIVGVKGRKADIIIVKKFA